MPDVFDRIDAPAGDVFDRISPAAVAKSPRRAGPASTARRQGRVAHALPSPAPTPRPAVNGPQPASSAAPLFDPHYGLPQASAAAPATADDLIARALGRPPAPAPHPIRMGLAGTGRGSEAQERPEPPMPVGPLTHHYSRAGATTRSKLLNQTGQGTLTRILSGKFQDPKSVGEIFNTPLGLGEDFAQTIHPTGNDPLSAVVRGAEGFLTPTSMLLAGGAGLVPGIARGGAAAVGLSPRAVATAPRVAQGAMEAGFGAYQGAEAIKQARQGQGWDAALNLLLAGAGGLGAAHHLGPEATNIFNRLRRTPDAALQEESLARAAKTDVRAGEGGEVGAGRGAGQGTGQQGEPPAGTRPPQAEGTPEQAAQGGPQVTLPHEQAAAELLQRTGHGPRARADAQAAAKHLETLKAHGYDTGDIQGALDEHAAIKRSDYERGEDGQADYETEKADAWRNVVDAFDGAEHPAAAEAAPPPPTEPPTGEPVEGDAESSRPEGQTSARNAWMNEGREAFGLDIFDHPDHVSDAETYMRAREQRVPERWAQIVTEAPKRPLTDVETVGLTFKQRQMENEWESLQAAVHTPGLSEDAQVGYGARMEALQTEFDTLTNALNKTGTLQARALRSRQITLDRSYSVIEQRSRLRGAAAKAGRDVAPKELERADDLATKQAAAQKAAEEHEQAVAQERAQVSAAAAEKQVAAVVEDIKRDVAAEHKTARGKKRATLDEQRASILEKMRKLSNTGRTEEGGEGTVYFGAGLTSDHLVLFGRLARNLVESGVNEAGALVDAIHDLVKDVFPEGITKEEVRDAVSGYGYTKQPSENEVSRQLVQIRRIMRLEARLTDIQAKRRPLRSGYQYAEDRPDVAMLRQQVEQAYKDAGMGRATEEARLRAQKTSLKNQAKELQRRLDQKDFGPRAKREPMKLDAEGMALRAERDRLRDLMNEQLQKYKRTKWDTFVAVNREWILSSTSIFEKLFGATVWGYQTESAADVVGAGMRVAPGIRRLSTISGGREAAPIGSAVRGTVTGARAGLSRQAVRNAVATLKKGVNDLTTAAGAKPHAQELGGYVGRLHGTEKAFLQTAEYNRSLTMRVEGALRAGLDPTKPEVGAAVQTDAAVDAWDKILQGDNKLADALNRMIGAVRSVTPAGGAVTRTFVPITRVASNLLGRTAELTGAGVPRGAYLHLRALMREKAGVDITPKDATAILRAYKYGGLGLATAALVWEQRKTHGKLLQGGGFYQPGKKPQGGHGLKPGELRIFGGKVPTLLAHAPLANAIQFWETLFDAYDRAKLTAGESAPLGAAAATVPGIAEQTPGVEALKPLSDIATGRPGEMGRAVGRYGAQITVPQLIQGYASGNVPLPAAAKAHMPGMDVTRSGKPVPRKPTGKFTQQAKEQYELALPWLRRHVRGRYNLP